MCLALQSHPDLITGLCHINLMQSSPFLKTVQLNWASILEPSIININQHELGEPNVVQTILPGIFLLFYLALMLDGQSWQSFAYSSNLFLNIAMKWGKYVAWLSPD